MQGGQGELRTDGMKVVRRRYHLHFPGIVYVLTTLFLAAGAINGQNNLLFWAFGLAAAGLILSGVVSGAALMGLRVERLPPAPGHVDGAFSIRYRVSNRNRFFPCFAIHIDELEPGSGASWGAKLSQPHAFVAFIPAGGELEARAAARCTARGGVEFEELLAWSVFPFGLARKSVRYAAKVTSIVRPGVIRVSPALARAAIAAARSRGSAARRVNYADEFYGTREYAPGDSPRSIAWRPSARGESTIVRQFAAASPVRVRIVLDLASVDPAAGERAISVGAGIAEACERAGFEFGVMVPAAGVSTPVRDGPLHLEAVFDSLALLPPTSELPAGSVSATGGGREVTLVVHAESRAQSPGPDVIHIDASDHATAAGAVKGAA